MAFPALLAAFGKAAAVAAGTELGGQMFKKQEKPELELPPQRARSHVSPFRTAKQPFVQPVAGRAEDNPVIQAFLRY